MSLERAVDAAMKVEYRVEFLYSDTGIAQLISRSAWFSRVHLAVTLLYLIYMAVDTDLGDSSTAFSTIKLLFALFFMVALGINVMAFRRRRMFLKDFSTMFEFLLLLLLLAACGSDLIAARVDFFDLSQLLRQVMLIRAVPELCVLVRAFSKASRPVAFTVVLLSVFVYAFAIILCRATRDTDVGKSHLQSVPESMSTLILYGVFLSDIAAFAGDLRDVSWGIEVVYFSFVSIALMLVVVMWGALLEVSSISSAANKESMEVKHLVDCIRDIFTLNMKDEWADHGRIPWKDAQQLLANKDVARELNIKLGIGAGVLEQAFAPPSRQYDDTYNDITLSELMKVLIRLSRHDAATLSDFVFMGFADQDSPATSDEKETNELDNNNNNNNNMD